MNQKKRKLYLITAVIITAVIFGVFFLKVFIAEKVLNIYKEKLDLVPDVKISVGYLKNGFFSDVILKNVKVYCSKGKKQNLLNVKELKINISLKDMFNYLIFQKKIKSVSLSFKNPALLLDNVIKTKINIQKLFVDFFPENFPVSVAIKEGRILISSGKETLVSDFNSVMEFNDAKMDIENASFKYNGLKITCKGYGIKQHKNIDLFIMAESGPVDLELKCKGLLNDLKLDVTAEINKKIWTNINGRILLEENNIIADSLNIGNNYKLNGNFNVLSKKGNFKIKGSKILDKRRQGDFYFSGLDYSKIFSCMLDFSKFPDFNMEFKIEKFNTEKVDLISTIFLNARADFKDYILKGRFYTQGSVLNYYPFFEINSDFALTKENFIFENFSAKNFFDMSLKADLTNSHFIDFKLNTAEINLKDFLTHYYPEYAGEISGLVDLQVSANGNLNNLEINGKLNSKNGIIKNLKYEVLDWKVKGRKDYLEFYDSFIKQQQEYYEVTGGFNPFKIGSYGFFNGVNLISGHKVFSWEGWKFSETSHGDGLKLRKELGEDFKVGFSAYMENDLSGLSDISENENELELEYSLTKDKSLKLQLKDEEEILGIQHSIEF